MSETHVLAATHQRQESDYQRLIDKLVAEYLTIHAPSQLSAD
jgi:hypothetical protein